MCGRAIEQRHGVGGSAIILERTEIGIDRNARGSQLVGTGPSAALIGYSDQIASRGNECALRIRHGVAGIERDDCAKDHALPAYGRDAANAAAARSLLAWCSAPLPPLPVLPLIVAEITDIFPRL